jgi:antitoxin VapB
MATGTERRAKLFQNGRSQAVRLPREFRFEGKEVRIRRMGQSVVLEPVSVSNASDWAWLDEWRRRHGLLLDDAFIAAVNEKPLAQKRPELDRLFAEMDLKREATGHLSICSTATS